MCQIETGRESERVRVREGQREKGERDIETVEIGEGSPTACTINE